jgi:hypothetical protein
MSSAPALEMSLCATCDSSGPAFAACATCEAKCCPACFGLELLAYDAEGVHEATLLMGALRKLGARCSTCSLIEDAASKAQWGSFMWLPTVGDRVTTVRLEPEELREWAFGAWEHVILCANATAALAIVATRTDGKLLYSVGGYGSASVGVGRRFINFANGRLNEKQLQVSRPLSSSLSISPVLARELQRNTHASSMIPS